MKGKTSIQGMQKHLGQSASKDQAMKDITKGCRKNYVCQHAYYFKLLQFKERTVSINTMVL